MLSFNTQHFVAECKVEEESQKPKQLKKEKQLFLMKTRLNCFWNCCLYFALQNCVGKGSGVTPKTHISVRS
jgi:hypothetical protein